MQERRATFFLAQQEVQLKLILCVCVELRTVGVLKCTLTVASMKSMNERRLSGLSLLHEMSKQYAKHTGLHALDDIKPYMMVHVRRLFVYLKSFGLCS